MEPLSSTACNTTRPVKRMSPVDPEDEVVISGLSGYFPESDNLHEFRDNLYNKVDMVTDDDRRWKLDHPEIPQRTGKINHVNRFDAFYFNVSYKEAYSMDPMSRILLEKAYEAIVDAGVNPSKLHNTRTGVYIGACSSESERQWVYEKGLTNCYGITGCSRFMMANRISYWLGCRGPSYTMDTACSSSLYALEHAYCAIREGNIDAALVGGANLCLHPFINMQFFRLGVLSPQGKCKSFDNDGNGYARSETVSMLYLQKAKDAKRIYATVVHAKTNCDGYKEEGITYPSGIVQQELFQDFYAECGINPATLDFMEAHGTGTRVGDPEELNSIASVFCKGRETPLLIGSTKSNLGHSEPASGMCSIAKVIISMENEHLAPNLHYTTPREGVDALADGSLKVVTEKTPWRGGLVGINSFGFGGGNCHVLLRWNDKTKVNGGEPLDTIPRLVVASGCTREAVQAILEDVESRPIDAEYVRLLHNLHSSNIRRHTYRGYTLLSMEKKNIQDVKYYSGIRLPVWFVFSGLGSQWYGMGKSLLQIPVFAATIELCYRILRPKGIDIVRIIADEDPHIFDNILNCFVGITAIQVGLVDILRALGIVPDGIIGHGIGELACAYADGTFTNEQAILAAYFCGLAFMESEFIHGSMVTVGLGYQQVKDMCPPEIEVACHNGLDSSTISGPADIMKKFVAELQARKIFAKEVNCANIAYHSRYIASAGPSLLTYLSLVIPHPKPRSAKWVSSSIPQAHWNSPQAELSSAEYHTNNLLSSVLFEEASRLIPANAICIEIAPHEQLQSALNYSYGDGAVHISLSQRGQDGTEMLLVGLGKLYEMGLQPQLASLYPEVQYPVSRGTPMISPLVRWDHAEDWYVASYCMQEKMETGERSVKISMSDEMVTYMYGHVIDGRTLLPATGYLTYVWESVGMMAGILYTEVPIVFENVIFTRATHLPKDGEIELAIMVQKGSGNFEVAEGGTTVVSGRVRVPENIATEQVDFTPLVPTQGDDLLDMLVKDIYKELRLRGYNYTGLFRGLIAADNSGLSGKVAWQNNWVAFMDCMLQLQILARDSRSLYVPTAIQKLSVDIKRHISELQLMDEEEQVFPVYINPQLNIMRCGGVEVRGLKASSITRRRPLGEPVLERYQFVPHYVTPTIPLDLQQIVRMCVHVALENQMSIKVKAVELLDSESDPQAGVLAPQLVNILGDLPLIQASITVLSSADNPAVAELGPTITVSEHKLSAESGSLLVVGSNLLERPDVLQTALKVLADNGCIIARETRLVDLSAIGFGLQVLVDQTVDKERILLLKKGVQSTKLNLTVVEITEKNYSWLASLQATLKDIDPRQRVVLVAQSEPLSGILGLFNCIRKELGGELARCYFILDDRAPRFDPALAMYSTQLDKDLAVNVLRDGQWGSYRHLLMEENPMIKVKHAYNNMTTRGDLSTLTWLEGDLDPDNLKQVNNMELVHIYYSSLNFKDVMIASGKLAIDVIHKNRLQQDCVLGFEFSGRTETGRRIMGMNTCKAIANVVMCDEILMWDVPDAWTLEEAATVPIAYSTVLYSLVTAGRMKKGESILIHAGSGGVGQAAINVALHYGLTVYTTVGTQEKRDFLKRQFPQLKEQNIGNSRDTSFEKMVMRETNSKGVDMVLNSLAGDKLQASARCLAKNGRFLEIGKFDMANNTKLGMEMFLKQTSFHGIILDQFLEGSVDAKMELRRELDKAIKDGAVRPLVRTVFKDTEVEQAYRYMAAGKHIGKVLIQIRPEEMIKDTMVPEVHIMKARPRFYCNPNCSYIIIGGLGGFGLELADWLVLRGARKLVLTSRKGITTGYQSSRIRIWRGYGAAVHISTADVSTLEGAEQLLTESSSLGPVKGIFNLAVVLHDALFENQTEEYFVESAKAKAVATRHLDALSRRLCPYLEHFVVFSSVSCGRGNTGQTNYGMSNSVMERVCEARARDGLPALAVQWGAVGEVGLVAEMQEEQHELVIGGTLQQRISSCMEALDGFLRQPHPVVASMVVAEKRAGSGGATNIVECVTNILGLRDIKTVSAVATLPELGMDSMMAVEIKQALEREYEVFLTPQDIRTLTFARLHKLAAVAATSTATTEQEPSTEESGAPMLEVQVDGLQFLMHSIGDELASREPIIQLPSMATGGHRTPLFMLPGVEGIASTLKPLSRNLNAHVQCLQMAYDNPATTIQDMAIALLPHIKSRLIPGAPFSILGYSFGALLALEVAAMLEAEGCRGRVVLVDGAPDFLREMSSRSLGSSEDSLQVNIILQLLKMAIPQESADIEELRPKLQQLTSWDERCNLVYSTVVDKMTESRRHQHMIVMNATHTRIMSVMRYQWQHKQLLTSPVTLLRATHPAFITEDDYGLSKLCQHKLNVHLVDGNHISLLVSKDTADIINQIMNTSNIDDFSTAE